jgi:hypothetical protein
MPFLSELALHEKRRKATKGEAGYATTGPFSCGHCDHFDAPKTCSKVDGAVKAEDCCNLFERAT